MMAREIAVYTLRKIGEVSSATAGADASLDGADIFISSLFAGDAYLDK